MSVDGCLWLLWNELAAWFSIASKITRFIDYLKKTKYFQISFQQYPQHVVDSITIISQSIHLWIIGSTEWWCVWCHIAIYAWRIKISFQKNFNQKIIINPKYIESIYYFKNDPTKEFIRIKYIPPGRILIYKGDLPHQDIYRF